MVKIAGRVVTLGMLVCLFMVALAQKGEVPLADGLNDKWAHLLAFAVLAIGFSVWWQIKTWLMVLGLIFYGVAIEVAQLYVPYHHATVLDLELQGKNEHFKKPKTSIGNNCVSILLERDIPRSNASVSGYKRHGYTQTGASVALPCYGSFCRKSIRISGS